LYSEKLLYVESHRSIRYIFGVWDSFLHISRFIDPGNSAGVSTHWSTCSPHVRSVRITAEMTG